MRSRLRHRLKGLGDVFAVFAAGVSDNSCKQDSKSMGVVKKPAAADAIDKLNRMAP